MIETDARDRAANVELLKQQNTDFRAMIRAQIEQLRRELNIHESENFPTGVPQNIGSFVGTKNPSISIVVDGATAQPASFGASFVDSTNASNTAVSLA